MGKYEKAREKYSPRKAGKKVKILFIAESPPRSGEYFYFEKGRKGPLFNGMMETIFPKEHNKEKVKLLKMFQNRGYLLIDSYPTPINDKSPSKRRNLIKQNTDVIIKEIKNLSNKNTRIALICKGTVYKILYSKMKGTFNVYDKPLYFPSRQWKKEFSTTLKKIIERKE